MADWLRSYNNLFEMHNASIITTTFGGFCVAFFIAICWPKLVELYGALGGLVGGAVVVGTFWVMNHKLPGFGIEPTGIEHPDGTGIQQFGLIAQGLNCTAPWVDMGLAVGAGLFVASLMEAKDGGEKIGPLLTESAPRLGAVLLGGAIGGAIVALIGFSGAAL